MRLVLALTGNNTRGRREYVPIVLQAPSLELALMGRERGANSFRTNLSVRHPCRTRPA